ncbi:uncharacterized protein LOC120475662 [Pimephales promelas]|uniref:uncharacterized protein LOC120475662 n=1 Tax=Pimephales promelas TaxID=90988 RepID=UPI0019558552|nr:uncharacterized protein LOC120475662 [Pimephales promelas]
MRNLPFFFGALLLLDGSLWDDVSHPLPSQKSRDLVRLEPIIIIIIIIISKLSWIKSFSLDAVRSDINMRNLSLLLGLVLVHGVFGVDEVKSVSVMVGDSLTLNSDFTETKGDELQWRIEGESNVLAQIDREVNKFLVPGNNEERFRGRLKLDHQTGSLTIMNIRNTDSGEYELKIKDSMNENNYRFTVTVRDVFFVDTDGVKSVSVTEGDTVTLHTGVTGDQLMWKFGDQELNGPDDKRWRNIDLDNEHRDLTITNIRSDQSGEYKLKIETSSMILQRKLHINVHGEMTPVSEKEGDPVILHTRLILHINDQIKWMFNGQLIPEINEGTNGRLYLDRPSGSLIITKSKITDSGVYQLNMISSSHTVQRDISVTVIVSAQQTPDPGLSSGALAGIVGGVVLLVSAVLAAVVIYQCRTISKLRRDPEDPNSSNDHQRSSNSRRRDQHCQRR